MWNIIGRVEKASNWATGKGDRADFYRPVFEGKLTLTNLILDQSVELVAPTKRYYRINRKHFMNMIVGMNGTLKYGELPAQRYVLTGKQNAWAGRPMLCYLTPIIDGIEIEDWIKFKNKQEAIDYKEGIIEKIPTIL